MNYEVKCEVKYNKVPFDILTSLPAWLQTGSVFRVLVLNLNLDLNLAL